MHRLPFQPARRFDSRRRLNKAGIIRNLLRTAIDVVASIRTAAVLFVLIIGASIAGTAASVGFYRSWWFAALLAAFGLNLAACTLKGAVARKTKAGSFTTHVGILVILAGVIIGAVSGKTGHLGLSEGQSSRTFIDGDTERPLPFEVRLDDFQIGWSNDSAHELSVFVNDPPTGARVRTAPGSRFAVEGTGYEIEVLKFIPDLFVGDDMKVSSKSDDPNNPALQLKITRGGKSEKRWVFAAHPDIMMAGDGNISFKYAYRPEPIDFKAEITVIDDAGTATSALVEVNSPLKFKGYSIYQAHFDPARPAWTGFDIVSDPGVNVVYAGILVLNIGVFLVFYRRFKKSQLPST